jgi:hypothetical protein
VSPASAHETPERDAEVVASPAVTTALDDVRAAEVGRGLNSLPIRGEQHCRIGRCRPKAFRAASHRDETEQESSMTLSTRLLVRRSCAHGTDDAGLSRGSTRPLETPLSAASEAVDLPTQLPYACSRTWMAASTESPRSAPFCQLSTLELTLAGFPLIEKGKRAERPFRSPAAACRVTAVAGLGWMRPLPIRRRFGYTWPA